MALRDWRPHSLERLVEKAQKVGGLHVRDLEVHDKLLITVGGQVVYLEVINPESGRVGVSINGPWKLLLHITSYWGSTLGPDSLALRVHWIAPGFPLSIDSLITPPVTKIILNGCDLTLPGDRKPS